MTLSEVLVAAIRATADSVVRMRTSLFVAAPLLFAACAPRPIALENIARIETEKRFKLNETGQTPYVERGTVVIEGERLNEVLNGARCKEGNVMWKGGIPATITLKVGAPVRADGFSEYGNFIKIHSNQWCELTDEGWKALWRE